MIQGLLRQSFEQEKEFYLSLTNLLKLQIKAIPIDEKWMSKYKKSINCSNPKGFSQKAHCAGKKKKK